MARYLSEEWIAALHAAASTDAGLRAATVDASLVVQQVVTDSDGEVAYHVVVDEGDVSVRSGRAARPDITFTQDAATARAVIDGELSAQSAFMAGRVRIGGDLGALIANHSALAVLDDVFSAVRATTSS